MAGVERPAPALVPLGPPHLAPIPVARRDGVPSQLVPPSELALADFARHLALSARRRTAGAYLDTLQRLLAFQVDPLVADINPRPETLLNGASLGAVRVQLASTGECINYIPTGGDFYLDSCVSGDKNEYFWLDATGGSSFGVPQYWLINVAASQDGAVGVGNYAYMTETGLGQPDSIWAEPPGWGIAAVWGRGMPNQLLVAVAQRITPATSGLLRSLADPRPAGHPV